MLKNLVYFGSPEFSAEILESIIELKLVNVVGVVTTPDKPQGRKQIITPSPLAILASKYNLPVYKPQTLPAGRQVDDDNLTHLKLLKPDIFLVVSYGKIIPKSWIDTPTIGTFNIHFSLLPKYRGALCISEAIRNQDPETGVTLMEMDEQLDHGAIVSQAKVAIEIEDNVATLITKLTQTAIEVLKQKLPEICAQNYLSTPQDESRVIFTPSHKTLTHANAFIPWLELAPCLHDSSLRGAKRRGNLTPLQAHALIRSLSPEPGAWTVIPSGVEGSHSITIKILKTSLVQDKLIIEQVQMAGKQSISWKQFSTGHSALLSHPL